MRKISALCAIAIVVGAAQTASADELIKGECLIRVSGRTYEDGPCRIRLSHDGSFQTDIGRPGGAFAVVSVDGDRADAFWNGPEGASHAHDSLGTVARHGGCWTNQIARICAWSAGTRPVSMEGMARSPQEVVKKKIDVPIYAGGSEKFDACTAAGYVVGLNPKGDGFLSVRSGPGGKPYSEIDRLYNGNQVVVCDEKGPWLGVLYGPQSVDCGTGTPWPTRLPYTGPCSYGWIHSKYVKLTVG